MRFLFKTSYGRDVDLIKHGGQRFWCALLGLPTAPSRVAPWIATVPLTITWS